MRANLRWIPPLLIGAGYLAVSLADLGRSPLVREDEPWIAGAAAHLARTGEFGNPLFTGLAGAEHHVYMHPPLFLLGEGAWFRVAGVGLVQARTFSVLCGLLVLVLAYALGRQLGGPRTGLLAILLLVFLRLAHGWEASGIPLLDIARIARYDILVPVFGLAALLAFNRARRVDSSRWHFASGFLIGLAALAHLYGAFLLPALFVVLLFDARPARSRWNGAALLAGGLLLAWLPALLWIATGWSDFLGQQHALASRYALFDPRFYLSNLWYEILRYRPLAPRDPTLMWPVRQFGIWVVLVALPVALFRALRRAPRTGAAFAVAVALLVQALLFALLLRMKMYNYIIALWPLAVVLLAWLTVELTRSAAAAINTRKATTARAVFAVILALVVVEGAWRIAVAHRIARGMTPYTDFTSRIAAVIPDGALVLGLPNYWLGMSRVDYRAWNLPFAQSDTTRAGAAAISMTVALARIDPDIVLMDRYMTEALERMADPRDVRHALYAGIREYLETHHARTLAVVTDPTYGRIEIRALDASRASEPARPPAGDRPR